MNRVRDLHSSLKSEILAKANISNVELILVRLAWAKDDVAFSLHVAPRSFSTSGIQLPDLLNYIGFSRQPCQFFHSECFVKQVNADFDIGLFGEAIGNAYRELVTAESRLESCGFRLIQPEGWGFFFGKQQRDRRRDEYFGDGHTSAFSERMNAIEDDVFQFRLTWISNSDQEKGWTIHYRPKHLPLSVELQGVFSFLGIKSFNSCPEFDFEPCYWRHIEYIQRGDSPFDSNADMAHRMFEAHQQYFSPGIKALLASNSTMERVGMGFLRPLSKPEIRLEQEISRRLSVQSDSRLSAGHEDLNFDVAISFAGTERKYAEELATRLRSAGFKVFYDMFFPEDLWGKNLVEFFHEIYSKRSRYCVIFVSAEYLRREWTVHERRSAQERMLAERGQEYILPIKIEDVELPGVPGTIGHLPIQLGIDEIANILIKKLKKM